MGLSQRGQTGVEIGAAVLVALLFINIISLPGMIAEQEEKFKQLCTLKLSGYHPDVPECASKEHCKKLIFERYLEKYYSEEYGFDYGGYEEAKDALKSFIDMHADALVYINQLKAVYNDIDRLCINFDSHKSAVALKNLYIYLGHATAMPYLLFVPDKRNGNFPPAAEYLKVLEEKWKEDPAEESSFVNIYTDAKEYLDTLNRHMDKGDGSFASIVNRYIMNVADAEDVENSELFRAFREAASKEAVTRQFEKFVRKIKGKVNKEFSKKLSEMTKDLLDDIPIPDGIIKEAFQFAINSLIGFYFENERLKNIETVVEAVANFGPKNTLKELDKVFGIDDDSAISKFYAFVRREIEVRRNARENCNAWLNGNININLNYRLEEIGNKIDSINDAAELFDDEVLNKLRFIAKTESQSYAEKIHLNKAKEEFSIKASRLKSRLSTLKRNIKCEEIGSGSEKGKLQKYVELSKINNEVIELNKSLEMYEEEWEKTIKFCIKAAENVLKEIDSLDAQNLNNAIEELMYEANSVIEGKGLESCAKIVKRYDILEKIKNSALFKEGYERCNEELENLIAFLKKNDIDIASFEDEEKEYADFKSAYFECEKEKNEILELLNNSEAAKKIIELFEEIEDLRKKLRIIDFIPEKFEEKIMELEKRYYDKNNELVNIHKIEDVEKFIEDLEDTKRKLYELFSKALIDYIQKNAFVSFSVDKLPIEGKPINAILHIKIDNPFNEQFILEKRIKFCTNVGNELTEEKNICVNIAKLPFEIKKEVKGIIVRSTLKSIYAEIINSTIKIEKLLKMPKILNKLPGLQIKVEDGKINAAYCDGRMINFYDNNNAQWIKIKPYCKEVKLVYEYKDAAEVKLREVNSKQIEEKVEKKFRVDVKNKSGLLLKNVKLYLSLPTNEISSIEVVDDSGKKMPFSNFGEKIAVGIRELKSNISFFLVVLFEDLEGLIEREKSKLLIILDELKRKAPKSFLAEIEELKEKVNKANRIDSLMQLKNKIEELKEEIENELEYKELYLMRKEKILRQLETFGSYLDEVFVEEIAAIIEEADKLFEKEKYRDAYEMINDIEIEIPKNKKEEIVDRKEKVDKEREKLKQIFKLLKIEFEDKYENYEEEFNDALAWNDAKAAEEVIDNMEKETKRNAEYLAEKCVTKLNKLKLKIKKLKKHFPLIKTLIKKYIKLIPKAKIKSYRFSISTDWLNLKNEELRNWEKEVKAVESKIKKLEKYLNKEDYESFAKEFAMLQVDELENEVLEVKDNLEKEDSKLEAHAKIMLAKAKDVVKNSNKGIDLLQKAEDNLAKDDFIGVIEIAEKILAIPQKDAGGFDIVMVTPLLAAAAFGTIFIMRKRKSEIMDLEAEEFEEFN